jgi:GNAT superfamily N-acetyltransferase
MPPRRPNEDAPLQLHPLALPHVEHLHELYRSAPDYFARLSTPIPTPGEVQREIETALFDPRRKLELIYDGPELIGCLDTKSDYPEDGDLTINLLLVRGDRQSQGYGSRVLAGLERRCALDTPAPGTRRLLASVLGDNPRAVAFWQKLGFHFAIDAGPVMAWYAKPVGAAVNATAS